MNIICFYKIHYPKFKFFIIFFEFCVTKIFTNRKNAVKYGRRLEIKRGGNQKSLSHSFFSFVLKAGSIEFYNYLKNFK